MLNVAFINTFIAKLSFSPSKVTSNDFCLLYPSLGQVCNPREKGIVGGEGREQERFRQERLGRCSPCGFSLHAAARGDASPAWRRASLLGNQLARGTETAPLKFVNHCKYEVLEASNDDI